MVFYVRKLKRDSVTGIEAASDTDKLLQQKEEEVRIHCYILTTLF